MGLLVLLQYPLTLWTFVEAYKDITGTTAKGGWVDGARNCNE